MDEFLILLQAKLDEASLKGIKGNLEQLKKEFEELKIKPVLDQQALSDLSAKINKLFTENKITISNINVDNSQAVRNAQQTGQQIGKQIQNGINSVIQKETLQQNSHFQLTSEIMLPKLLKKNFKKLQMALLLSKSK